MRTRCSTPRRSFRASAIAPLLVIGSMLAACTSNDGSDAGAATSAVATTLTDDDTSPTTSTTSTTLPPTTTTEPYVLVGAIVMVANCSSKNGSAAQLTSDLAAFGFTMGVPTNGFGPDSKLATSKIYAKPEAEAVAKSLSRLLDNIPIERFPTPAWVTGGTEAIGATSILVMLGNDLAGKHLGEIATD